MRDTLRDLLKDEDERGNSLNTRAAALTGFVGVILSLAAAAALTGDEPTRDWVKALVLVFIVVALVSLLSAVGTAVFLVLRPQRGFTIGLEDTDRFNDTGFTSLEPPSFHRYQINAYSRTLNVARKRNDKKAHWLTISYVAMATGVAAVALAAFTATLDRYVGGAAAERGATRHHHHHHGDRWHHQPRAEPPRRGPG